MEDIVHDDEVLFRCVFFEDVERPKRYVLDDGTLRVTSAAFLDRNMQISVDRASLCENNPTHTQKNESDGVIMFVAHEIRAVDDLKKSGGNKDKPAIDYIMDVVPAPEEENPAHAELRANPHFDEIDRKKAFRTLRYKLAEIANRHGWLIKPNGFR